LKPSHDRSLVEEKIFALLQEAAVEGQRCPTNPQIAEHLSESGIKVAGTSIPGFLKSLILAGRIVVRVYARNWRGVTICSGSHAGKTTQPPPHGGKPHLILTADGRTGRTASTRERILPF
jgi:hypothetical protein